MCIIINNKKSNENNEKTDSTDNCSVPGLLVRGWLRQR